MTSQLSLPIFVMRDKALAQGTRPRGAGCPSDRVHLQCYTSAESGLQAPVCILCTSELPPPSRRNSTPYLEVPQVPCRFSTPLPLAPNDPCKGSFSPPHPQNTHHSARRHATPGQGKPSELCRVGFERRDPPCSAQQPAHCCCTSTPTRRFLRPVLRPPQLLSPVLA